MRTKKRVVIDDFSNSDQAKVELLYNYSPKKKLNNSIGIKNATFQVLIIIFLLLVLQSVFPEA